MTREVAAACAGATAGGSDGVFVKDAHDSARNLIPAELPEDIQIFRGWGSDIHSMMSGLDASFSGVIFTGYHSSSNTDFSPLAHTMNLENCSVRINGIQASEMVINCLVAGYYDVPVLMITGDLGVCEAARRMNPNIYIVPVQTGKGNGTISIHPNEAVRRIRETAEEAVREGLAHPEKFKIELPNHFDVEVEFRHHAKARRASFYPGVRQRARVRWPSPRTRITTCCVSSCSACELKGRKAGPGFLPFNYKKFLSPREAKRGV